jgi:hypothetical protein
LERARAGIYLNLITHRYPTNVCNSDSCPYGLGGFTWKGRAGLIRIPSTSVLYGYHKINNALECLAMVITIWLKALGDSTSAIGWLFHSSSLRGSSIYTSATLMARKLATLLLDYSSGRFGQHLPGSLNTVADQLSFANQVRDGKPNMLAADSPCNAELTQHFHQQIPQLILQAFAISQLPTELSSFAVLVLQTMESSMMQSAKHRSNENTGPGDDGLASAKQPGSITFSSISYLTKAKSSSSAPSFRAIGSPFGPSQASFIDSIQTPYRR